MKRLLVVFALIVSLVLPLGAQAVTVSELQAQIQSLLQMVSGLQSQLATQYQSGGVSSVVDTVLPIVQQTAPDLLTLACPHITATLSLGAHDVTTQGAVSQLQQYLVQAGVYPEGQITGYYGALTARAVARLQAQYGLDPVGVFGPQTRALVSRICGNPGPVACTMEYNPVCGQPPYTCPVGAFCATVMPAPKTYGNMCMLKADNATLLYTGECDSVTGGTNKPPVVSGVSGPTVLAIGETGTWSVTAYDPESGSLSYQVDWGDVYMPSAQLQGAYEAYFRQTSTFTHSYSTAGTYTIRVTVSDDAGSTAHTSTTVRVGAGNIACTREYNPVCGLGMHPCCVGPTHPEYTTACHTMRVSCTETKKTYSNACILTASGATLLHYGECGIDTGVAPDTCKIWYDGCNTCSRAYPGGPLMCTMMACFQNAGAYCRESF